MLIRDWAIAFLVLGLIVTLLGATGMGGGTWTFIAIAAFIVISGVMMVVDTSRGKGKLT